MTPSRVPPAHVPTLTEVIEVGGDELAASLVQAAPLGELTAAAMPSEAQPPGLTSLEPGGPSPLSTEQLTQSVLHDVQRHVDLMLEYRLREALSPILSRVADSLIKDTRAELASTLRDVVARAVAQELMRHRSR